MNRVRLGVNIDHVATVRQARRGARPDPVEAGLVCERAGADSIVCHLREDRRHIQDEDVRRLKASLHGRLNLEMSVAPDVVDAALTIRPQQVTLVPERRQELTTEGGLDAVGMTDQLRPLVAAFEACRITVSLFIDATPAQVQAAQALGARSIELHTGRFAQAATEAAREQERAALIDAARLGRALQLAVAAGHGLDYDDVGDIAAIEEIEELNIGFSVVSRALTVGLETAVREMIDLLKQARPHALETA